MSEMTERQKTFARLLANDPMGNKTVAAKGAGCPDKSASVTASGWLKNPRIIAEIERLRAKTEEKLDISAEKVLAALAKIGFSDIRKLFTDDGTLKGINELDDETAGAIAGIEHEKLFEHFGKGQAKHTGTTVKVKMADKLRALELLGKWHKLNLFTERIEVTGNEKLIAILAAGRKRISGNGGN